MATFTTLFFFFSIKIWEMGYRESINNKWVDTVIVKPKQKIQYKHTKKKKMQ
jgi:hypothetical protein